MFLCVCLVFFDCNNPAEAMKDPDCFCVKDTKGNKVCEPDGCDKGKAAP